MNGWQGGDLFKIKPDHMQLVNPIMTLAILPLFTRFIYPAFERCGIKVTLLRRMSLGQILTAFSFVIAGFIQGWIESELTPIPYYKNQNSIMVINGLHKQQVNVSSEYWICCNVEFTLEGDNWRTNTFSWIRDDLPISDQLRINEKKYQIGSDLQNDFILSAQTITSFVHYYDTRQQTAAGAVETFSYISPQEKSDSIRVKTVLVNPTQFWIFPSLVEYDKHTNNSRKINFSGNGPTKNSTVVEPFNVVTQGAEMEQGIYKIVFDLFRNGDMDQTGKNLTDFVMTCETDYIFDQDDSESEAEFLLLPGSIWTFVITENDGECEIKYGQDSNANTVNILWLIPQYFVITFGEVLNSATGNEFIYTQAPLSMKSVVGSFWFLTTCIGNLINIVLVEVKFSANQSGEYFVLAIIMFVASVIFSLLAAFYYKYVPTTEFDKNRKITQTSFTVL